MKLRLALLLCSVASAAFFVPEPTGPYDVAMKVQEIIDYSRPQDPLDARPQAHGRRLLFSVFLPVERRGKPRSCPLMTIPYMTPGVAASYGQQAAAAGLPADIFSQFNFQICDISKTSPCGAKGHGGKKFPVIMFTPGLMESRLLYGAGARSLASQGYIVVTVDHPYEAPYVDFPDGTVIVGEDMPDADEDEALKTKLMSIRTSDLSFVIDQLHNRTLAQPLFSNFAPSVDLGRIAVYAHSVGGSAAAMLVRADKRVLGGLDFDGQITEPIRGQDLNKPFILAGRFNHTGEDATWNALWPHLRGPRVEIATNGTQHGSYTDRPLILTALNLPPEVLERLSPDLGTIEGRRLEKIVNDILVGFFDLVFYKRMQNLKALPELFPEVTITRSNL